MQRAGELILPIPALIAGDKGVVAGLAGELRAVPAHGAVLGDMQDRAAIHQQPVAAVFFRDLRVGRRSDQGE